MIIGLGSDIISIDRVAILLNKSGDKFKEKTFTKYEIEASARYGENNSQAIAAHFAKRFAAKEAFAKAVGTGFGKHLSFTDVGIKSDASGKPIITLNKKAQNLVQSIAGEGKEIACHISISDDYPYALAVVIIEVVSDDI